MREHGHFNRFAENDPKPIASSRVKPALNGFDPKKLSSDGLLHYGWTGKAWIIWLDGDVLAFGDIFTDVFWVYRLCSAINKHQGTCFIDLGHEAPEAGSKELKRWLKKQEKQLIYGSDEDEESDIEIIDYLNQILGV